MFAIPRSVTNFALAVLLLLAAGQSAWAQVIVTFADPDLEALVRAAVGRPQGPLFSQYLRDGALLELDASNRGVSNLGGLQYAVDLEVLNLSGNSIRDLTPLSTLTDLRILDLSDNRVNNVAPLQPLRDLEELDLSENDIASIEDLLPNTGLGAGDTVDVRGNELDARTRCGVLATLATRGATVLADGACMGTSENPGDVDQQPDLFGTLRTHDPNSNEEGVASCGAVEVYRNTTLVATAVTDSRGFFYVEGLQAGQIYDLVCHARGYEDVELDNVILQQGGHEVIPPVFQILSEPVITGTILLTVFDQDAPRPPIAGALVRVVQFNIEVARTVTCADGYFEFDNNAIPFPGTAQLRFSAEDFVPEPLDVILPAFDLLIGLEKLTFPNSIVGVVVDGVTGDPIEGAEVLVQPTLGLVTHTRTTDADGAYVVDNVDDGEYSAHATAEGFDPITRFGFVEQDLLQLDLELPREGQSAIGCAPANGTGNPSADMIMLTAVLGGLLAWQRRSHLEKGL